MSHSVTEGPQSDHQNEGQAQAEAGPEGGARVEEVVGLQERAGETQEDGPDQRLRSEQETEVATKSGNWPPSLRVRRQGLAMTAFLKATHAQTSCEAMSDVTPSFAEALEWIRSRKSDLDTALRLCHLYPNLIQEECLDGLWDFLLPFIQKGTKLNRSSTLDDSRLDGGLMPAEISIPNHGTDSKRNYKSKRCKQSQLDIKETEYAKNIFVCVSCNNEDSLCSTAAMKLISKLTSHYFVRCSSASPSIDAIVSIRQASVFVFVLDAYTLNNENNIKELMEAWSNSIPIVMLKHRNYQLPENLPAHLQKIKVHRKDPSPRWIGKMVCLKPPSSQLSAETSELPRLEIISPKSDESQHPCGDLSQITTLKISSCDVMTHTETLEGFLKKLIPDSIEYDANSLEPCIKAIRDKLSLYEMKGKEMPKSSNMHTEGKCHNNKSDNLQLPECHSPCILSPTDALLLSNMDSSFTDHENLGILPGIRGVRRSASTHSAPEAFRLPTPPPSPRPSSPSRAGCRPSPSPHPRGLLPPIRPPSGGSLRKHRSQELPSWHSPPSTRRTTYLISSRPGTDPRLVTWPPEAPDDTEGDLCADSYGSVDLPEFDADEDSSICFGIASYDIDLSSPSPVPDFV